MENTASVPTSSSNDEKEAKSATSEEKTNEQKEKSSKFKRAPRDPTAFWKVISDQEERFFGRDFSSCLFT